MGKYTKIIILMVLILTLLITESTIAAGVTYGSRGVTVRRLQQDLAYLGYFSGAVTGYYGLYTRRVVKQFQQEHSLKVDGEAGPKTLALVATLVREKSTNLASRRNDTMGLLTWAEVDQLWARGVSFKVWDVDTHKSFMAWRMGGVFHADVEPLTKEDTATLLEVCGGHWTVARRAVLVEIRGRLIAASMYPYPHGSEMIHNNGYRGQFCLHFLGSRVHISGKIDPGHLEAIFKAAEASKNWQTTIETSNSTQQGTTGNNDGTSEEPQNTDESKTSVTYLDNLEESTN